MAMSSKYRRPVLVALGLGVLGLFGFSKRKEISNLYQNSTKVRISIDVAFKRLHAIRGSILSPVAEVVFSANILNLTGFDLKAQKVFVFLEALKGGKWEQIGRTKQVIQEWPLADGLDSKREITLSINLLPLIATLSDPNGKFRTLTYYSVGEVAMDAYPAEIELGRYLSIAALKKKILELGKGKVSGLGDLNSLLL